MMVVDGQEVSKQLSSECRSACMMLYHLGKNLRFDFARSFANPADHAQIKHLICLFFQSLKSLFEGQSSYLDILPGIFSC